MDDSSTKFRYLSVYQDIKDKIEKGVLLQGEKLKTEKEYQQEYGEIGRASCRERVSLHV